MFSPLDLVLRRPFEAASSAVAFTYRFLSRNPHAAGATGQGTDSPRPATSSERS
jgi:hypothetical protein